MDLYSNKKEVHRYQLRASEISAPFSIYFIFQANMVLMTGKPSIRYLLQIRGKVIFSKTHELLKDRNELVLREIKTQDTNIFKILEDTEQILVPSLNFNTLDIKNLLWIKASILPL